ncbi:MAG: redoxin domain-containing protein [Planctomycetota bacterium]
MKIRTLVMLAVGTALSTSPALRADDPDAKEIVKAADDATKEVQGISYDAESFGEGALADQSPHIKGSFKLKKPKSSMLGALTGGSIPPMRCEGTLKRPGGEEVVKFRVATDGKIAYAIDDDKKTFTKADMPEGAQSLRAGLALLFQEYAHPTPFSDELKGERKYEGIKNVGDEECHVIYVTYSGGQGEARWYFSKKDSLPRRVDRVVKRDDDVGTRVLQITNVEVDPEFKKGTFKLKLPEGYKERELEGNDEPDEPQLLAVGSKAPDFELSTPDGKTVSLKDLKGSVVVLDFWATWCGPCKVAMPGVQKLHEQFKGKPVKIYGVNTWERGGDPAKFMKDKEFTYGLLLKGDKTADKYKVTGIPTFYVIDPNGKIVHASSGMKPGHEKELGKIIEKAMKDADA